MKTQTNQQHSTILLATMLCLVFPIIGKAQKENGKKPPTYCNCFVRPIPFKCGQICGWRLTQPSDNKPPVNAVVSSTTVGIDLKTAQNVSVKIYDASGRMISNIVGGRLAAGYHKIEWRSNQILKSQLPAGVYFLKSVTGGDVVTKKVIITKLAMQQNT